MSLRQVRKEETRERLLETAASLFLKNDFTSVSIGDIAQEVGVSKGAVFYHFSTKKELALETLKWFIANKFIKILENHKSQPKRELLQRIISESITVSLEYPRLLNFLFQMLSLEESAQFLMLINQMFQPYFQMLTQELKGLNIPNPEMKTLMIFAMIDGLSLHLALQIQVEQKTFSKEYITTLTDEIIQLFFGKSDDADSSN